MPDIKRYQAIQRATKEYLIHTTAATNTTTTLEMVFDREITLQAIQTQYFTNTSTGNPPTGDLFLKYPTGQELPVATGISNWSMNQSNDDRNLWYSLPAMTSIYWKPTNPSNGLACCLFLSVVGYSG